MYLKKIHNWIFGLAILASVFSFAGSATVSLTNNGNSIELLVTEKKPRIASDFYFGYNYSKTNKYCSFSFKSLLNAQNALRANQIETFSKKALVHISYNHFLFLKHSVNKGDYQTIFIG